ncbi:MAG: alpha/beta hydrolase [Candidatus Hydrogenedentes bacterium]|nr:alpha/beta hydrolase [Candidatus Hydrogenedentota bacterium]
MVRVLAIAALLSAPMAYAGAYRTERGKVYADLGDKKLKMTLYLPEDDGAALRPGVVLIHGGAWIFGTRYQQLWYCRHFARHGYVVMTIDYRLMPKHPFPNCLHDCKAAVRWMRLNAEKYRVDPDRIFAFGASAGGHLASLLATTNSEDGFEGDANPGASSEIRAAISLYGAVDLTLYRDEPRFGVFGKMTKQFMKEFTAPEAHDADDAAVEVASPITYARPTSKPVLLVHGTDDILVHYEQSVRFHERLKELGVPTRLITAENRNHGFDYVHTRQRRKIFREMLAFYEEHGSKVP